MLSSTIASRVFLSRTTITRAPWRLPPLGANRALSRMRSSTSSGSGSSVNRRTAPVVRMTSYNSMAYILTVGFWRDEDTPELPVRRVDHRVGRGRSGREGAEAPLRGASRPRIRPGRHPLHGLLGPRLPGLPARRNPGVRHHRRADGGHELALLLGGRHLAEDGRHDA